MGDGEPAEDEAARAAMEKAESWVSPSEEEAEAASRHTEAAGMEAEALERELAELAEAESEAERALAEADAASLEAEAEAAEAEAEAVALEVEVLEAEAEAAEAEAAAAEAIATHAGVEAAEEPEAEEASASSTEVAESSFYSKNAFSRDPRPKGQALRGPQLGYINWDKVQYHIKSFQLRALAPHLHPNEFRVIMSVNLKNMGLDKGGEKCLKAIVGKRYDEKRRILTLQSRRFESRVENRLFLQGLLKVLVKETEQLQKEQGL